LRHDTAQFAVGLQSLEYAFVVTLAFLDIQKTPYEHMEDMALLVAMTSIIENTTRNILDCA